MFFVANFVFTLVIYLLFQKAFEVTRYPYQSPLTSDASSNVPLLQKVPGVREDDDDYDYDDDDEWECGSKEHERPHQATGLTADQWIRMKQSRHERIEHRRRSTATKPRNHNSVHSSPTFSWTRLPSPIIDSNGDDPRLSNPFCGQTTSVHPEPAPVDDAPQSSNEVFMNSRKAQQWFHTVRRAVMKYKRRDLFLHQGGLPYEFAYILILGWIQLDECRTWADGRHTVGQGLVDLVKQKENGTVWKVSEFDEAMTAEELEAFADSWVKLSRSPEGAGAYSEGDDREDLERYGPLGPAVRWLASSLEEIDMAIADVADPELGGDLAFVPDRLRPIFELLKKPAGATEPSESKPNVSSKEPESTPAAAANQEQEEARAEAERLQKRAELMARLEAEKKEAIATKEAKDTKPQMGSFTFSLPIDQQPQSTSVPLGSTEDAAEEPKQVPPTAPAQAPISPSVSVEEATDTNSEHVATSTVQAPTSTSVSVEEATDTNPEHVATSTAQAPTSPPVSVEEATDTNPDHVATGMANQAAPEQHPQEMSAGTVQNATTESEQPAATVASHANAPEHVPHPEPSQPIDSGEQPVPTGQQDLPDPAGHVQGTSERGQGGTSVYADNQADEDDDDGKIDVEKGIEAILEEEKQSDEEKDAEKTSEKEEGEVTNEENAGEIDVEKEVERMLEEEKEDEADVEAELLETIADDKADAKEVDLDVLAMDDEDSEMEDCTPPIAPATSTEVPVPDESPMPEAAVNEVVYVCVEEEDIDMGVSCPEVDMTVDARTGISEAVEAPMDAQGHERSSSADPTPQSTFGMTEPEVSTAEAEMADPPPVAPVAQVITTSVTKQEVVMKEAELKEAPPATAPEAAIANNEAQKEDVTTGAAEKKDVPSTAVLKLSSSEGEAEKQETNTEKTEMTESSPAPVPKPESTIRPSVPLPSSSISRRLMTPTVPQNPVKMGTFVKLPKTPPPTTTTPADPPEATSPPPPVPASFATPPPSPKLAPQVQDKVSTPSSAPAASETKPTSTEAPSAPPRRIIRRLPRTTAYTAVQTIAPPACPDPPKAPSPTNQVLAKAFAPEPTEQPPSGRKPEFSTWGSRPAPITRPNAEFGAMHPPALAFPKPRKTYVDPNAAAKALLGKFKGKNEAATSAAKPPPARDPARDRELMPPPDFIPSRPRPSMLGPPPSEAGSSKLPPPVFLPERPPPPKEPKAPRRLQLGGFMRPIGDLTRYSGMATFERPDDTIWLDWGDMGKGKGKGKEKEKEKGKEKGKGTETARDTVAGGSMEMDSDSADPVTPSQLLSPAPTVPVPAQSTNAQPESTESKPSSSSEAEPSAPTPGPPAETEAPSAPAPQTAAAATTGSSPYYDDDDDGEIIEDPETGEKLCW